MWFSDNLQEVLDSGLPWGLMLYGEEEEKFLEASTDPVLSLIWKVYIFSCVPERCSGAIYIDN